MNNHTSSGHDFHESQNAINPQPIFVRYISHILTLTVLSVQKLPSCNQQYKSPSILYKLLSHSVDFGLTRLNYSFRWTSHEGFWLRFWSSLAKILDFIPNLKSLVEQIEIPHLFENGKDFFFNPFSFFQRCFWTIYPSLRLKLHSFMDFFRWKGLF